LTNTATDADATRMVRDLEHNGRLELVFDQSDWEQNHCAPHWPVIYAWTGADYEDVSPRFKRFYAEKLAEVRRTLFAMEAAKKSGPAGSVASVKIDDEDCVKAEAGKIERLMGASPDAGLKDAIKWSRSQDTDQRQFAVDILHDIATPKAFARLHSMMSDPDESVANRAEEFWKDSPAAQKEMHTPPPLLAADWSATAKPSLATRPPTKADVAALLAYADNLKQGTADGNLPQDEDIDSFQFVDLRGSGVLSLVAETNLNEKHGGYVVEILDKTLAGLAHYWMWVDPGPDEVVAQDLDGDGKYELVIDQRFIFQCEACCNPTLPWIYAWTGAGYKNVSKRFPRFYQRKIETLRSETEAWRRKWAAGSPAPGTPEPADCRKIETAKIERFLGRSPDAGLDYAIALSKSAEWRDRMLAAQVFADIGTAEAIKDLHALSRDPENAVARTAEKVLASPKVEPPAEIPER